MLDQKTIDIVKSTVPVLEEHGESITKRFYQLMFGNHPELLNIFNHANQKQGRQQRALASAVYAAAKYIDNLESILPAVSQIAQKHRSLGIKPEQYPIVGKHLLFAIKDVLGDAATDEIMTAWEKAYGEIADAFINFEKGLYEKAGSQRGGWVDFKEFKVDKVVKESDVIKSFYFVPADSGEIASFIPGQYISIRLKDIPGEKFNHIRQYSLSQCKDGNYYRISVKREDPINDRPAGKVSTFLHSHIKEGDIVELSAPAGEFILEEQTEKTTVLLSGGVGITPMFCMLQKLADKKQKTTFIQAAVNGNVHAFRDAVKEIEANNEMINAYFCYEKPTEEDKMEKQYDKTGYITADWLNELITDKESTVYMCGPVPFMQAMYEALLEIGIKKDNIRYEFFGPSMQLKEPTTVL